MTNQRRIRVLVTKPGLDGHETGAKLIARVLRDAGMEVIYTGARQTPESIARAAMQEDVDVIGMSILSGAHKELCARVMERLREAGVDDTLVLVGGIVPLRDVDLLKGMGIHAVFGPGSDTREIVDFIHRELPKVRPGLPVGPGPDR